MYSNGVLISLCPNSRTPQVPVSGIKPRSVQFEWISDLIYGRSSLKDDTWSFSRWAMRSDMFRRIAVLPFFVFAAICTQVPLARTETIDKIAAVVDGRIIT